MGAAGQLALELPRTWPAGALIWRVNRFELQCGQTGFAGPRIKSSHSFLHFVQKYS